VRWRGAPEFSSKDGKFKAKIRGRLHIDGNYVDQGDGAIGASAAGVPTIAKDIAATRFRRARLGIQGTVFWDVDYILEADFAEDNVVLTDAYVQYSGFPVKARVGQFKTFNALEEMTSSNYITFMERSSMSNAFELGVRRIGAGAIYDENKHFTLAAGYFGANSGVVQNIESEAFGARATLAAINNDRNTVHLGASYRHRSHGDEGRFRYRQRAVDLAQTDRFVDTLAIGDSDDFWGLEGAVVLGPFSVQSEYGELKVDPTSGLVSGANGFTLSGSPTYAAGYVEGSVFLTGERRPYDKGAFGRVKVKNPVLWGEGKRGWGAWQIAGRYDALDLNDGLTVNRTAPAAAGPFNCFPVNAGAANPNNFRFMCGKQETWQLGVNWYLNDYTRLMFNYAESDIDDNLNDGLKVRGVGVRAQVDW
ncbi:MAG: OprO/OprP family phosphate-selective porin, partial [Methyloceanibacter sp.]